MQILFIGIGVICAFQIGILAFCFRHRRDPLLFLPRAQRMEVLMRLVHTVSDLQAIRVFAEAILSKSYGHLNIAQTEFTHQMLEKSAHARERIAELLDPSQPHTIASNTHDVPVPATDISDPLLGYLQRPSTPPQSAV